MKRALVIWFFVAALVAMGCSPPPDSFGSVRTLDDSWIEIWDWYDLDAIRNDLSGSYVLMTDLDSSTAGYEELAGPEADDGNGWQPIAPGWWEPFNGTLDGQGYEIRDLFIHRPGEARVALFDCVTGVIQDVGLAGVNIRGSSDVAGLVGENNRGTITNCYSSGEVSGGWKVGGLVGWNSRGTVRNSSFAGSVTGDLQVGGLVGVDWGNVIDSRASAIVSGNREVGGLAGNNNRGSVRNSYFTGSVTGNEHVGGLIGSNEATVGNSYSTASVTGGDNVGGLVGRNWFHGTVRNSYSSSTVTGENTVGGLVGHNDSQGDVSNSYATGTVTGQHLVGGLVGHNVTGIVSQSFWDIETSGTERSGGGMGKTTAEMKDIDTFLTAGWDIEMTAEANPTDGYPFLAWQLGSSPIWYISAIPTVTTQAANDVTADSATINMEFTVGDYSPVELRFSWREVGQDWETTNWVSKTESGTHGETITGLDPGISYEFRAQLRYNGTVIDGATLTFITALEPVLTYAITISSTDGGLVSEPGEGTFDYEDGTVVDLGATPDTGYHFVNWTGDVSTIANVNDPETAITMNDDYSISANFAIDQYTLTYTAGPGGSISGVTPQTVSHSSDGTEVEAVPDTDYHFVDWSDSSTDNPRTDTNVTSDITVTANFEAVAVAQTACVESATGTGEVCITTSHGVIEDLEALLSIPPTPPADIVFPHGMFSFKVTVLELGQTVTITVELPDPVPAGTRWWKEHMGAWYSIPVTVVEPNVISFTLADGVFPGDSDNAEDGVITDPGGPGNPVPSLTVGWDGTPVNKAAVAAPWIALLATMMAGAGLLVLRRRLTQN